MGKFLVICDWRWKMLVTGGLRRKVQWLVISGWYNPSPANPQPSPWWTSYVFYCTNKTIVMPSHPILVVANTVKYNQKIWMNGKWKVNKRMSLWHLSNHVHQSAGNELSVLKGSLFSALPKQEIYERVQSISLSVGPHGCPSSCIPPWRMDGCSSYWIPWSGTMAHWCM